MIIKNDDDRVLTGELAQWVSSRSVNMRTWVQFPRTNTKLGTAGTSSPTHRRMVGRDRRNPGNSRASWPGPRSREQLRDFVSNKLESKDPHPRTVFWPCHTYTPVLTRGHIERRALKEEEKGVGWTSTDSLFLDTLDFFPHFELDLGLTNLNGPIHHLSVWLF